MTGVDVMLQVYVDVLDVNDNEPVFTHQLYRASVPESSYLGQHVVRVSATDKDKDSRLLYSLVAAASTTSLAKFKMPDESNGEGQWQADKTKLNKTLCTHRPVLCSS